MQFAHTDKVRQLVDRLQGFMERWIYPNEATYRAQQQATADRWQPLPIIEALKGEARGQGLWNLCLPNAALGPGLTTLEYAPLAEIMGRVPWAAEVFNCASPDAGNMEILDRYGNVAQKERWLRPLLAGELRSAFCMTEPDVASSDATNIRCQIRRDGHDYVIDGRKWWSSGVGDPRCTLLFVLGRTAPDAPRHRQQSIVLVPRDTPGVRILRKLSVFGYDDAPHGHGEILFDAVRVPIENVLHTEGKGFEIAQARLGPERIHHCMQAIGVAERALELGCQRLLQRETFGQRLAEQGMMIGRVGDARVAIDQARLLVLRAAWKMDLAGSKDARADIAAIKVAVPRMAAAVVDWAIQVHGAAGVSDDFALAAMYAAVRALRIMEGPDEVHRLQIGRREIARHRRSEPGPPAPSFAERFRWPGAAADLLP